MPGRTRGGLECLNVSATCCWFARPPFVVRRNESRFPAQLRRYSVLPAPWESSCFRRGDNAMRKSWIDPLGSRAAAPGGAVSLLQGGGDKYEDDSGPNGIPRVHALGARNCASSCPPV